MYTQTALNRAVSAAAALVLTLSGVSAVGHAAEQAAEGEKTSAPTVMAAKDALKAMSGMAGYYRVAPTGDVFLYPRMKLAEKMYGMYGTYQVTPDGILLRPGGADGVTMAESAMGGASGAFRITPTGQAYFYPREEQAQGAVGMGSKDSE